MSSKNITEDTTLGSSAFSVRVDNQTYNQIKNKATLEVTNLGPDKIYLNQIIINGKTLDITLPFDFATSKIAIINAKRTIRFEGTVLLTCENDNVTSKLVNHAPTYIQFLLTDGTIKRYSFTGNYSCKN
jgi:membrane-bound inhibitor of C-type lysozyme